MGNESNRDNGFNAIYNSYKRDVFYYAYNITRNHEDAEDIVQDVFLRFFVLNECEEIAYPKGWLSKAVRNRALNVKRDRKQHFSLFDEECKQEIDKKCPDVMDEFFDKMLRKEILEYTGEIMQALREHNKKWYDAVAMVYFMEVSGKEAAECFGMTRNAFDCMLQRTKKWIKENYGEGYDLIMHIK